MPKIGFWLNATVLFAVFSFMYNAYFSFIGIKDKIGERKSIYIFYYFGALFLVFLTALTSAKQEQVTALTSARQEEEISSEKFQNEKINSQYNELIKGIENISMQLHLNSNQSVNTLIQEILRALGARNIDSFTAKEISEELKTAGHQKITVFSANDAESEQYANQFISILKSAGWNVEGPPPNLILVPVTGLHMEVKYSGFFPPSAQLLANALTKHSISVSPEVSVNSNIESGSFNFIIGSKPLINIEKTNFR